MYVVRTTIYLPDDLAGQVKQANINVSAVCQEALRRELDMLETLKATARVEVELEERSVAFQGTEVAYAEHKDTTFYVTARGAVAVYSGENLSLDLQPNFAAFAKEYVSWPQVSEVAEAMGEPFVEVLDI